MKPFPLLSVSDKKLTKGEREASRIRIDQYYQKKVVALQKYVYKAFNDFHAGKISTFECF
jgi:hypothetical protein